jgi:serine protease inhibitor
MKKIVFLFLSCLLINCTDAIEENNSVNKNRNGNSLAIPINDFGFNLFSILANCNDNVIISPLGIHCDLAMVSNAANNATLDEMKKVMHISALNEYNLDYKDLLEEISIDDAKNLSLHNGLFYDTNRLSLNDDFYSILNKNYFCEKTTCDFNSPSAVGLINQWVADKTKNKITEIVDQINDENAFFINTVYYKDDWQKGFDKNNTGKSNFNNEDLSISEIDMMYTRYSINCILSPDFDAVDLPMKNENYSFTAIMPKTKTLTEFINEVGKEASFTQWFNTHVSSKLENLDLNLNLPKFKLKLDYSLNKSLMKLGMNDLFSNGIPNMSMPSAPNPVGYVNHNVFFDLNESGIEGAAVTVVGIVAEVSPYSIRFDKPFLFVLRNNRTNLPIFIGKISKL